jgi:hypothetical protein
MGVTAAMVKDNKVEEAIGQTEMPGEADTLTLRLGYFASATRPLCRETELFVGNAAARLL